MAKPEEADLSFRLGAAVLATAAGAALGLLFGVLFLYFGWSQLLGRPVVGGAVAGAVSGLLLPAGAMAFVEGTVHFFFGFLAGGEAEVNDANSGLLLGGVEKPSWLRWAMALGALLALALWVTFPS